MAKTKQQKKEIIEKVTDKISKAKSAIFLGYEKVKIKDQDKIRKTLKKENGEYLVTKKTILTLVLKNLKLEELNNLTLDKEVSVVLGYGDEIAPARLTAKFVKEIANLKIKGGFFEKKIIGIDIIKFLSSLPSKDVVRAQLISGLQAPISGLVNVLEANIRALINIFDSLSKKTS